MSDKKQNNDELIIQLIHKLADKNPARASEARLELESLGRRVTVPFFNNWKNLSHQELFATIEILSQLRSTVTARRAVERFRTEGDSKLRASLITLIGNSGSSKDMHFLASQLRNPDKRIRANAVEAISELGGPEVIQLLMPLLKDPSNRVKANTAKALWEFDEVRDIVKQVFEEMVEDGSKWMKASAFYAFGEMGIMEFFNLLVDSLDEDDQDIARNAVLALIGYADKFDPDPS